MTPKHLIFYILITTHFVTFSQNELVWGKKEGQSSHLLKILPFHGKDFFALRYKSGMIGGYYLSRQDDLQETRSVRVSLSANKNVATFNNAYMIEEHPVVFLTNTRNDLLEVYAKKYSFLLEENEEADLLHSFELEPKYKDNPVSIIQSKNKAYFAVLIVPNPKKDAATQFHYAIFDSTFQKQNTGTIELAGSSKQLDLVSSSLSNNGTLVVLAKTIRENSNRQFNDAKWIDDQIHVYQVGKENEQNHYQSEVFVDDELNSSTILFTENQSVLILSLMRKSTEIGIKQIELASNSDSIIKEQFIPFADGQLTINNRINEQNIQNSFINFTLTDAFYLKDGAVVGVLEQYHIETSFYSDSWGGFSSVNKYYYNDILTFKINDNGGLDWVERILKSQLSSTDENIYSSYTAYIDSNELVVLFNDNLKNYNESGTFEGNQIHYSSLSKRNHVVAIANIDLYSGILKRNTLFKRKKTKTVLIPHASISSKQLGGMLVYSCFRGIELFGTLNSTH